MDKKKNYITQKKLARTAYGYSQRGAYFDERKGRYVRIDRGRFQSDLKKAVRRSIRRKLNRNYNPYSKGNQTNRLEDFWWKLD